MDRELRRKKSERARTRRSRLKKVIETIQNRLHKRLKHKRLKLSKIKNRHHDGKL